MTAEIVNLRRARKAKARAGHEAVAAENRVRFGRTKDERRVAEAHAALDERRLEGHRLDGSGLEDNRHPTVAPPDAAGAAKAGGQNKPGEDHRSGEDQT